MNRPTERNHRRHARSAGAAAMPGFTLVEMAVVVSILVVMLGILAPSFVEFLATQQAKALSYDLTADLMLARNEALKRNANVAITRGGTGWEQGWTVATVATNQTLSHRNPAAQAVSVSGAPAAITFDVNGRVIAPLATVRITISSHSSSRCVELDLSGRARSLAGACT
jgi:type IV fimbrial biogenesis protein FimT